MKYSKPYVTPRLILSVPMPADIIRTSDELKDPYEEDLPWDLT